MAQHTQATSGAATSGQMNEFVRVIDEFMQKYARLISPQTRTEVFASGNPALISEYEKAVSRGGLLKTNIEVVTGAWAAAKRAYSSVTDVTSMVIGDAIDWVKSLFNTLPPVAPQIGALAAVQIPAAVWIVGTIAASAALILSIDRIFITLEANRIQRDSPGTSRQQAITQAKSAVGLNVFGDVKQLVVIGGIVFIAWLYLGQKK